MESPATARAGRRRRPARGADLPFVRAWAACLRGAMAGQTGNREAARTLLATALAGFDRSGMPLRREAARARLGDCGEPGRVDEAHGWLLAQGVLRPDRLVDALAPPLRDAGS